MELLVNIFLHVPMLTTHNSIRQALQNNRGKTEVDSRLLFQFRIVQLRREPGDGTRWKEVYWFSSPVSRRERRRGRGRRGRSWCGHLGRLSQEEGSHERNEGVLWGRRKFERGFLFSSSFVWCVCVRGWMGSKEEI